MQTRPHTNTLAHTGDVSETIRKFFERHRKRVGGTVDSALTLLDVDECLRKLSQLSREDEQVEFFRGLCRRCTPDDLRMVSMCECVCVQCAMCMCAYALTWRGVSTYDVRARPVDHVRTGVQFPNALCAVFFSLYVSATRDRLSASLGTICASTPVPNRCWLPSVRTPTPPTNRRAICALSSANTRRRLPRTASTRWRVAKRR